MIHNGPVYELELHRRVAANVRAEMARRGMTQRYVADLLGIAQQAVSARLRGKTPFTINEIGQLAQVFGLHPAVMLGGEGRYPDPSPGTRSSTDRALDYGSAVAASRRLVRVA